MSAPTPLRQDFDASQVRGLARKTKDGPQARRLLALAAIYDGATRTRCRAAFSGPQMVAGGDRTAWLTMQSITNRSLHQIPCYTGSTRRPETRRAR